jgi:hypothetical protein
MSDLEYWEEMQHEAFMIRLQVYYIMRALEVMEETEKTGE